MGYVFMAQGQIYPFIFTRKRYFWQSALQYG